MDHGVAFFLLGVFLELLSAASQVGSELSGRVERSLLVSLFELSARVRCDFRAGAEDSNELEEGWAADVDGAELECVAVGVEAKEEEEEDVEELGPRASKSRNISAR